MQSDPHPYKKRKFGHTKKHWQHPCTEEKPGEDTVRKWMSTSQRDTAEKKSNLPTPWSWTSSLQNCERINFCCSSHSGSGILLRGSSKWPHWNTAPPGLTDMHNLKKTPSSQKKRVEWWLPEVGEMGEGGQRVIYVMVTILTYFMFKSYQESIF